MSRMRSRFAAAVLAAGMLGGLAGCSGGNDAAPMQLQLFQGVKTAAGQAVQRRRGGTPQAVLSRAQLEATGLVITEITAERRGLTAYMFRALERTDSTPGRIEVWATEDSSVTVATRDGVVIATRGLGGDLLSSALLPEAGPQAGAQVLQISDLDDRERPLSLSCDIADLGPETIDIMGRAHATRHLRQSCEGGRGEVVNDYWSAGGIIWQSRQWAGPHLGYLRLRRVTK